MRRARITTTRRARQQFEQAIRWWRDNRANKELLKRELAGILELLAHNPEAGAWAPGLPGVRRILLLQTRYYLYYQVRELGVIDILAFWHTSRGSGPPLD
jgi:plasmid stabilization system protein ParE